MTNPKLLGMSVNPVNGILEVLFTRPPPHIHGWGHNIQHLSLKKSSNFDAAVENGHVDTVGGHGKERVGQTGILGLIYIAYHVKNS